MRLIAALVVLLAACGASTTVEFKPRDPSAALPSPVVEHAVMAYKDDAALLASVDAVILGSLEIEGSSSADEADVRARAIDDGARRGGTHVLVAVLRTNEEWDQVTADGTRRWGEGNAIREAPTDGHTIARDTSHGLFVVIRVPQERWPELPAALRPTAR